MTDLVHGRLDAAERTLRGLERELAELRALVSAGVEPEPEPAAPAPWPVLPPLPPRREPAVPAGGAQPAPTVRLPELPRVDLADLLGGRALAWAGGVVTLLGIVFFFVLAVDRGWVGPVERVGLGAGASALLLAGGVVARRRYGQLYSAVAAAGAGIAGGYATLLSAAALYGLVPDLGALALAAAIAAGGLALALAWRAQMLAAIGLVGAAVVPFSLVFEGGVSTLGTAFVALVFAASTVVAVRERWRPLLVAGAVAAVPQLVLLVLGEGPGAGAEVVAVAATFSAILLVAGLALERREGLDRLAAWLLLASGALAGGSLAPLLTGELWGLDRTGLALVAAGAVYGAAAAALFGRRGARDVSALLVAVGLALGTVGLAALLTGATLAIAWAAQGAVLAWLGGRVREPRYQLASLAYLGLALGHTLAFQARPEDFFSASAHTAAGVPSLLAFAVAALVFLRSSGRWEPLAAGGYVRDLLATLADLRPLWRAAVLWSAAGAAVYALSLLVVEGLDATPAAHGFSWGHVAVTALWAAGAALLLGLAGRWGPAALETAGTVLAAAALLKLVGFDLGSLGGTRGGWSAAAVTVGLLAAAWLVHGRGGAIEDATGLSFVLAAASAPVAVVAAVVLLPSGGAVDALGLALLGLALVYAALAAVRLRAARDFATQLWLTAALLALASPWLLFEDPTWVVASCAAIAVALSAAAVAARERRLQLGAAVVAAAGTAVALVEGASPLDLFVARPGPAAGVPALLLALAGVLAAGATYGRVRPAGADALDEAVEAAEPRGRSAAAVLGASLALLAASLGLLEGSQWLGGDLTAAFQRGHTAVSALWGFVGLVALHVGLARRLPPLKLAGFALFGVALAKLFLYDLTALSSVTRALSFLAVGAVLLLAGFFYQRLGAVPERKESAGAA